MSDILELSALAPEREKVRLRTETNPEGTIYELATPQDFGAVALRRLGLIFAELEELGQAKKLKPAQERRLETGLTDLSCELIRDAPREAVEALPAIDRRAIVLHFFVQAGERLSTMFPTLTLANS